jgi:hypothetical protein
MPHYTHDPDTVDSVPVAGCDPLPGRILGPTEPEPVPAPKKTAPLILEPS